MKMHERPWFQPIWFVLVVVAPLVAQSPEAPQARRNVELREPRFVPAMKAEFLKNEDQVLGVSANGVAKAYQPHVVSFHHIIDDRLGDMPILVTW